MTRYIIYFNQQWVGDHSDEWFTERGALAEALVTEMKEAGVYVVAGGVEQDADKAFRADATSGTIDVSEGPIRGAQEHLGGLTIIDVDDEATAKRWAGRLAEACGWPQEVRQLW